MIASGPSRFCRLRANLRFGVCHCEDNRRFRHRLDHLRKQGSSGGQSQKDIGTDQRLGQIAGIRHRRMRRLPLVHAVATLVNHAGPVAHDDVIGANAHRLHQFGTCNRRSPRTVHDNLDLIHRPVGKQAGINEAGRGDDRRAVLIIVKHRNVHSFAQGLLDNEAFGRLDIFKVDAAEARLHQFNRVDETVDILGLQLDIDRINIGEAFEQDGLALHYRLGGERTQIA